MNAVVRLWKTGLALMAAVVVLAGTSSALAGSLVALPKVTNLQDSTVQVGTFPTSITLDGAYVGGTAGLGFGSAGKDTGFVYDVGVGTAHHVIAGGYQDSVTGIGYRYPSDGGDREIVVGGSNGGNSESMNANTGVPPVNNWMKRRRTGTQREGLYNSVNGGSVGEDLILSTYKAPGVGNPIYVDAWSGGSPGAWVVNAPAQKGTTTESDIIGVSNPVGPDGSGVATAVGRRKDGGGVYQNYVLTYTEGTGGLAAAYVPGLDGTNHGELWDIADDGSWAGGVSPHSSKTGLWAYVRDMTSGSAYELPTANPSAEYSVNSRVYGMGPNGDYAVGMDFTAGGIEKAVLWDISDANPTNWTVLDLTQWASDNGILGPFTGNLRRAIAMGISTNPGEPVITGVGYSGSLEADGWTGFVLTIPEPGTVTLLAIGGLMLLLFRRRR